MTPPTTHSLTSPLAKFASACFENRRSKPAIGEICDSCGLSDSVVTHDAVLHDVAGESGERTAPEAAAPKAASDIERERLHQRRQRRGRRSGFDAIWQ